MSAPKRFASALSVTAAIAGLVVAGSGGSAGAVVNGGSAGTVVKPQFTTVAGSVAPFVSHTRATGSVPASQRLSVQLWLAPRTAAAARFADAVSTPGSPAFRQFLSPDAYTARFAATRAAAGRAESWLRSAGFTAVTAGPDRSYVGGTAAASTVGKAFGVQLKTYRPSAAVNGGGYVLRSNDRPVSLPAWLARIVSGVTGLDNAALAGPLAGPGVTTKGSAAAGCSQYYGQHSQVGLPKHFGRTSFPTQICGYSAKQLRAAYGANMANTGKGQTIALPELGLDPDMRETLRDWAKASGLPKPSPSRYTQITAGKGCPAGTTPARTTQSGTAQAGGALAAGAVAGQSAASPEEELDVEAAYAIAPGAKELVVGGLACGGTDPITQALLNADQAILGGTGKRPLATIVANSWEDFGAPASVVSAAHNLMLQAAAEGVGMYFGSGDRSGVDPPASDPYAIAVGGTTLGIGRAGNRLFETGWSDGSLALHNGHWTTQGETGASGGGPATRWAQPAYQKGVVPAALARAAGHAGRYRSVPDISADGDPFTAMATGILATQPGQKPRFILTPVAGTSLATPLIAATVADAQQGSTAPFGFLNPVLYKLAGTSALHDAQPVTTMSPSLYRAIWCGTGVCHTSFLSLTDDQHISLASGFTGQVTLKGYDNMTGLGTPSGQHFITALREEENR
jgi:subtilase family serine protease